MIIGRLISLIILCALVVVTGGLGLYASQPSARDANDTVVRLIVPSPEGADEKSRRLQRTEMAKLASERVEKRLNAVGFKDYSVTVERHGIIRIAVNRTTAQNTLASIVVPPGKFELRPVVTAGQDWASIEDILPESIELRYDADSLSVNHAYLWSRHNKSLRSFVDGLSLGQREVFIYPENSGWRTATLSQAKLNNASIRGIEKRVSPTGVPFVVMTLTSEALSQLQAQMASHNATSMALVIDGEIVRVLPYRSQQISPIIEFVPPPELTESRAKHLWVNQVVGRLAAPYPVTLAEFKE